MAPGRGQALARCWVRLARVPLRPPAVIRAPVFLSALAFLLAIAACTKSPAGPTLTGIAPDRGPADRDVAVVISGSSLAPVLITDFSRGSSSTLDTSVSARLGREPLTNAHLNSDGSI